jgi:hypothetical protein
MSRWGAPQSYTSTVPTAGEREGDFSALLALGANYQIYDPYSTRPGAASGRYQRDPYPNNVVPKTRFDPAGYNLAHLYPLPNVAGNRDGTSHYLHPTASTEEYWVHLGRFDHAFSERHRVFTRLNYDFWEEHKNRYYDTDIQGIVLNRINRGFALDDVYLLTPNLVLKVRYGITRQDFTEYRMTRGIDLGTLGFSSNLTKLINPQRATLSRMAAGAFTGFSIW